MILAIQDLFPEEGQSLVQGLAGEDRGQGLTGQDPGVVELRDQDREIGAGGDQGLIQGIDVQDVLGLAHTGGEIQDQDPGFLDLLHL